MSPLHEIGDNNYKIGMGGLGGEAPQKKIGGLGAKPPEKNVILRVNLEKNHTPKSYEDLWRPGLKKKKKHEQRLVFSQLNY